MDDENGTLMGAHGYCTQVQHLLTLHDVRQTQLFIFALPRIW
jgi:hypothetical protein